MPVSTIRPMVGIAPIREPSMINKYNSTIGRKMKRKSIRPNILIPKHNPWAFTRHTHCILLNLRGRKIRDPCRAMRYSESFNYIFTMHKLVLLRHGESQWNQENRFTGWHDVDLTPRGRARPVSLVACSRRRVSSLMSLTLPCSNGQSVHSGSP